MARHCGGFGAGGRGVNLRMAVDMADFTPPNLPNGGSAPFYNDRIIAHEMTHAVMARSTNWQSLTTTSLWFVEGAAEFIHGADERVVADVAAAAGGTQAAKIDAVVDDIASWGSTSADYSAGYIGVRYLHDKLKNAGFSGGIKDFMTYLNGQGAPTMDQAMTHFFGGGYTQASFLTEIQADSGNGQSNGVVFVLNRMNLSNSDTGAVGGLDADGGSIKTAQNVVDDLGGQYGDDVLAGFKESWEKTTTGVSDVRTASMQIGSEIGQTIDVKIGSVGLAALGLTEVDVATDAYSAMRSIVHLDEALEYVNKQRANLGAQLSRFESTISALTTNVEATSESRSRILDADYATETAAMVKANILRQAGTAIAAQANTLPSRVLALVQSL
jgi:flagellin